MFIYRTVTGDLNLISLLGKRQYYIVILRWPVGSRMLHQNTTVIRRVTTVRTERGVRLTVCQGDVSLVGAVTKNNKTN